MELSLGEGCELGCPVCAAAATSAKSGEAQLSGGGRRLTIRGAGEGALAMVARARAAGWEEIVLCAHAPEDVRALAAAGATAVRVPIFSQVPAVHDRIAGREDALVSSLGAMRDARAAGLRVEVEVPLLPRRLAHPLSIVRLAHEICAPLGAVRFVSPRGAIPRALRPPPMAELAALLAEALAWCRGEGIDAELGMEQGIPFCALREHAELQGAFRFDPRRARAAARGGSRPAPCERCACRAQCGGVADAYLAAHGAEGIVPFERRPRALYEQRTSPRRAWTSDQKDAARRAGLLVLRPTVNCNQDCTFCSANETTANVWTSPETMLRQIVRAAGRGVTRVAFSGGEPTLSKHLASYVRAARRLGLREVELVTNGTLLDRPERVRALADAGLTDAFVSLHAHDELLSRHLTQKIGDFDRTVRAIELLVAAGVKTVINHVITSRSARYLPEVVAFVRARFGGRVAISFAFVTPQYKALESPDLMPRMSDVMPHLTRALARALELDQPCWVGSRQGIPPCQLGAFRAWSDVLEHADAGIAEDAPQKIRAPGCDRCRYTALCTGVWRPYAERYGLGELVPIEGTPYGAAERRAIEAMKSEPWGLPRGGFEGVPELLRDREAEAALARLVAREVEPIPAMPFEPLRSRPLRVALLGSGARARRIARAIRDVRGLTIDAVVSPHAPEGGLADFGDCPAWRDAGEALDAVRPDAVIVAAAAGVQEALARAAIERGVPVLCARPFAPPGALLELAGLRGAVLVPAHELVHVAGLRELAAHASLEGLRIEHRVASAPQAWSRHGIAPLIHDALSVAALWTGERVSIAEAAHRGESRPEAIVLAIEARGARMMVEIAMGAGSESLSAHGGGTAWRADGAALARAIGAMLDSFRDAVLGRAVAFPPAADARSLSDATRAAIEALERAGAPFDRPGAPKHVASEGLR